MKTIEEKAKAYDEAKERAKKMTSDLTNLQAIREFIFPELRESEDERIRRFFAELATDACGGPGQEYYEELGLNYDKVMAWLEKQKEQKPIEDVAKDITKNKESATKFLKSANIMDNNGKLAEIYRSEQKPTEWSEEDILNLDRIVGSLNSLKQYIRENTAMSQEYKEAVFKRIEQELSFLKSLPKRFNLQPKQEWSEKDKRILQSLHHVMNCADAQNAVKRDGLSVADVCNFLFSIEPHWKPSEEQMKWLKDVIETVPMTCRQQLPLESLYADLQKLL